MNQILTAAAELIALLPHYISTNPGDERAKYFRGLMAKAADSLIAIDAIMKSTGPVWPLHCRWIIEAFGIASALNENENVLDQVKRNSANTYFLVAGTDPLGVEAPAELEKRKTLFLKVTVAAALSLPCFAHCPPSCGFDDDQFETISRLRDEAWQEIQTGAGDQV